MWLIYQLYIELGIKPSYIFLILQNLIFLDKEEILPFDDLINRQLSGKNLRKKQTGFLRIRIWSQANCDLYFLLYLLQIHSVFALFIVS